MPRPSSSNKRRLEANRKRRQAVQGTEAERKRRIEQRVEGLIQSALSRPRATRFDIEAALAEFDEARALCLAAGNGAAAARVTWYKAELCGLVVQRSAVLHAHADAPRDLTGDIRENQQRLVEDLRDRVGSKVADKFVKLLISSGMMPADIIDGEAIDVDPNAGDEAAGNLH